MIVAGWLLAGVIGAHAAAPAPDDVATTAIRYALLPPRNLTGDPFAARAVFERLERELVRRGAEFVPAETLDAFLRQARVRYTDSLSISDARALGESTQIDVVLTGTIFDYAPGFEPRLAFALRGLSTATGRRVLSCAVALRGVDFESWLGLGKIESIDELADEALSRALQSFDTGGAPLLQPVTPQARRRSGVPDGGWGFALDEFDPRSVERIAILPISNRSTRPDAGTQFSELVADAWFRGTGVQVVESAELRAAMVRLKVRSTQYVDLEMLADIGESLGVHYFAVGSVERFGEELFVDDERVPEVQATLQIIDSRTGRVVAAAGLHRSGDYYHKGLGLGIVRDPIGLAVITAREIVKSLGG